MVAGSKSEVAYSRPPAMVPPASRRESVRSNLATLVRRRLQRLRSSPGKLRVRPAVVLPGEHDLEERAMGQTAHRCA